MRWLGIRYQREEGLGWFSCNWDWSLIKIGEVAPDGQGCTERMETGQ